MARSLNIDKTELIEINGAGLILTVTKDEEDRMLVHVESDEGGGTIRISQHEEDGKTIVFSLDRPQQGGPSLRLVK
ncbi:hypothetical protein [Oceanispirochaeta sp.]|uniref:hypothetical protein n=1 Tax=Oceanispirochaeta sp. TaxID=2035350 RepID=UPI0026198C33|nr:hypothetical protein [Oceanispirochaeta sp.]MDA3957710.1 hypothetical protein [Oceanispirochaeta sp.]